MSSSVFPRFEPELNIIYWGPQLAIDGNYSKNTTSVGFFHSDGESYPWHMTILERPIHLVSVVIYNRNDARGDRLKLVEIRAGKRTIKGNHKGRITENTICGTFFGPGETGGIYTVKCDNHIDANIITLQIVENGAQFLQLDEVEFIKGICYNIAIKTQDDY